MALVSKAKSAIIILILVNIVWGAGNPIMKWALQDLHLYTFLFLRSLITAIILAVLFPKNIKITAKQFFQLFMLSIFGITLNYYFSYVGLLHTASINSPIIGSSGPIFIVLGSLLLFREKPKQKVLLGNLIGFFGVMVIVLAPLFERVTFDASLSGNVYLLLATIASVVYTLLLKNIAPKMKATTITMWYFFIGSVTFAFPFTEEVIKYGFLPHFNWQGGFGLIYSILFMSIFAYIGYAWSMKHILASEIVLFLYLDPVAALFVAAPLLHEYPTSTFIFGSFLIFFGIYIAERRLHWHPIHLFFKKH
ncbi:MAG TPA: DMT family transporter [Candidatus Saccharimonadales bacterium]|nr:DMT family transporter [Candidatus Saccharimonadales bacterium]